jgi:hypothetical protein
MTKGRVVLPWGIGLWMKKLYAKREASGSFHPHHDFEGKNKLKLCHPEANPEGPYRLVATTALHAIFFTENRTRCSDSKPRMGLPGKPRDLQFSQSVSDARPAGLQLIHGTTGDCG